MNRSARSHRSTKIPNVKLRPALRTQTQAPLSCSSKRQRDQNDQRDNQEDDEHFRQLRETGIDRGAHVDADFVGSAAKPLKGAIISMTGLGDSKAVLTKYAKELGAQVEGNLTEDVTHLIAELPGSEKYRCALELGMHIVKPEWITEIRERWLDGQDIKPQEVQHEHQLEPLQGIVLALAGVSGPERRRLRSLATNIGATVSEELRFDGTISHLVSATADPSASSSIYHVLRLQERAKKGYGGDKEEAAAALNVVWPEWLTDSQVAGGCLNEAHYSIFAQRPDQVKRDKLIAQASRKVPSPFVKRSALSTSSVISSSSPKRPRLSLDQDDKAKADSAAEQDEDKEEEIKLGPRASTSVTQGHGTLGRVISKIVASRDSASPATDLGNRAKSGLLSMSRASSFTQAQSSVKQALAPRRKSNENPNRIEEESTQGTSGDAGCFSGITLRIDMHDSKKADVLQSVLLSSGATIIAADDSGPAQYCVMESSASDRGNGKAPESIRGKEVTHFWIEYCLHHERFIQPEEYFASRPARATLPLKEASDLRIHVLGFPEGGPEMYHARKLTEEIGGTFVERLKSDISHVICVTSESRKISKAAKAASAGIPLVGLDFFETARMEGRLVPFSKPVLLARRSGSTSTSDSQMEYSTSRSEVVLSRNGSDVGADITNETTRSRTSARTGMSEDASPPPGPLYGCVIACTKSAIASSNSLEKKAFSLGASFLKAPDLTTTHLLYKGSTTPREVKDFATRASLVYPSWLDKCQADGTRLDERLFPSTLHPFKALATAVSQVPTESWMSQGQGVSQAAVAAARPWHRSLSAGTAQSSTSQYKPMAATREDDSDEELPGMHTEVDRGRSASPVAVSRDDDLPDVHILNAPDEANDLANLKDSLDRTATADQVIALLRSRALKQSSKRRSRLPARARNRTGSGADSPSLTHTSSTSSLEASARTAEQVLALQAEKEAQRAAEAAAHGFSLGLEKGAATQPFDASLRIVYDDPAARKERKKLLDLAGKQDEETEVEPQVEKEVTPEPEEKDDGFGRGRRSRDLPWQQSVSPTKRPIVRRQPLAGR